MKFLREMIVRRRPNDGLEPSADEDLPVSDFLALEPMRQRIARNTSSVPEDSDASEDMIDASDDVETAEEEDWMARLQALGSRRTEPVAPAPAIEEPVFEEDVPEVYMREDVEDESPDLEMPEIAEASEPDEAAWLARFENMNPDHARRPRSRPSQEPITRQVMFVDQDPVHSLSAGASGEHGIHEDDDEDVAGDELDTEEMFESPDLLDGIENLAEDEQDLDDETAVNEVRLAPVNERSASSGPNTEAHMPDEPRAASPLVSQRPTAASSARARRIWELDDDEQSAPSQVMPEPAPAAPTPAVASPIAAAAPRGGRVKTRLLGFQSVDDLGGSPFDRGRPAPAQEAIRFPVGWVVVVDGPGRGASFTLLSGVSPIGREEDQAIQLDYGDTAISRSNHAAIAYDDEQRKFFIGHGGKANIVRLNGRPVLVTEELSDGDEIRLGETTLRFVAFCGQKFAWDLDKKDPVRNVAQA